MSVPVSPQLEVVVNGKAVHLSHPHTVEALLKGLQVTGRLAVEVNGEIVPRSYHAEHALSAGDQIEVIHAIGGG